MVSILTSTGEYTDMNCNYTSEYTDVNGEYTGMNSGTKVGC